MALRVTRRFCAPAMGIAALAALSCIDPSAPKDVVCTDADTLAITVGPGLKPMISWTPECTAYVLAVVDSGPLEDLNTAYWIVISRDGVSSQVPASVTYGVLPPNTTHGPLPAQPLVSGHVYAVFVLEAGGNLISLAYFTP